MESLAAVAALSILLAFFQVVRGSARHGEELRLAMATHSAATRHCKSLTSTGAAEICLRQLNARAIAVQARTELLVSAATALK